MTVHDISTMKSGSIEQKISRARNLWANHGERLSVLPEVSLLLNRYREELSESRRLMDELGLVALCSTCSSEVDIGGCCGSGIEDWYDEILLLLNLMLDVDIPERRFDRRVCLFLGPEGCRIWARYHFCVNYLCPGIIASLEPRDLALLRAQSGKELFLCWELENRLKQELV
ncbi:MAG TPA: hypothetical protein EYP57_05310 [Thermodesulfobacteriaceae bacterium]|nr:hypothetical protein [Thermodesulfobacteriaceae bacterium]